MNRKWILYSWICFFLLGSGMLHAQLVTTIAGQAEVIGNTDGQALSQALFNNPHGIAIDGRGRLYIADRWNHKVRMMDTQTGLVTTLAGTGQIGADNGPGNVARFYEPWGITCDNDGNVYVADTKNYLIRKIDTLGNVTTIAGSGSFGVQDGSALSARFAEPSGIVLGLDGNLYICDHIGHTIRKLTPGGVVTTIAGQAFVDGDTDGPGAIARFYRPFDIDIDLDGNIIVADEWNHKIRKVTPTGFTSTIAGSGLLGSDNGPADQARFNFPWDVAVDSSGALFVMDGYNFTIRKIVNDTVSTYCGTTRSTGAQDGFGDQASFSGATALVYDFNSNSLFIADAFNELIRRVDPSTGISLLNDLNLKKNDTICIGTNVVFTAMPTNFVGYDFYVDGNLTQSNVINQFAYNFKDPGPVSFKVVGTHADGWMVESEIFTLIAVDAPDANFTYELLQSGVNGNEVRFIPFDTTANNYWWDFGDPSSGTANLSSLKSPIHLYPDEGPYSVSLRVSNGGSCVDTVYKADFVGILALTASPIQMRDTICLGESVSFAASTQAYNTYRFFVNGTQAVSSAAHTFTSTPNTVGAYEVYVEGVDGTGQIFQSPVFLFAVSAPPSSDYTWQTQGQVGNQYQVDFVDMSSGATAWDWTFGDLAAGPLNNSTVPNPSHLYSNYGRYDLQLITTGAGACKDTLIDNAAIVVAGLQGQAENSPGIWTDMPYGDTLCVGEALQLLAKPQGFAQYEFYLDNTLLQASASDIHNTILSQSGNYRFRLVGVESNGRRIEGGEWKVYAISPPVADFAIVDRRVTPQGFLVEFAAQGTGYSSYRWDFGDIASGLDNQSDLAQPTHTYADFGNYTVNLIVAVGGSCRDTVNKVDAVVFKDEPGNLFIPSAFTPNGDGANDQLYLYGNNIAAFEWSIYNEWGERIFNSQTLGQGWDGTYKGQPLPSDTYVYLAKVILANGQHVSLHGQTTLLR
ncbi:MAG: PKD domain-containing protein [Bacteroidia bacterium]